MQNLAHRLLPLLAACLLAFTACNSGGGDDTPTDTASSTDIVQQDSTTTDTNDPADVDGPADTTDQDSSECQCGDKVCGPGIGGCSCGDCGPGLNCSPAGQCVEPANENGSWCGPTAECPAFVPDPQNPGQTMWNPDYQQCRHNQCNSKFCLDAGAPGVFFKSPVCSRPCDITADEVNNKTGAPGPDGIEDPNVPFSDCDGFVDGPAGDKFVCASFAAAGSGLTVAYCVPGSHLGSCNTDSDCPEGEQCNFSTINGELSGQRCMAKTKAGDWGAVVGMSEACNGTDPFEGDGLSYCESGWCFGLGCVNYCAEDSDCDTTKIYEGTGCVDGQCAGWDGKSCTVDSDCSAWRCYTEGFQIFSDLEDYKPALCWPKSCDTDNDCAPGFYCRYNWNGGFDDDGMPTWEHICLKQVDDGADVGEECDADPNDNIPGATCKNEDMCVGGNCSALCETDADCGQDQLCTVYEFNVDTDDDEEADQSLPLQWCISFPGAGADCLSQVTCGDGMRCDPYEIGNYMDDGNGGEMLNPDAPYVLKGKCVTVEDPDSKGQTGAQCNGPSDCYSGFCLGADAATNTPGFCTQMCEAHAECPAIADGNGGQLTGVCTRLLYANGGDWNTVFGNIYLGLCQATQATGGDCSDDFTCPAGEACSPYVISFGADYKAKTDYICGNNTNADETVGSKTPKETCDPTLEDADGNAIAQCASGLCFEGTQDGEGYCSQLCDPANDTCSSVGTPDMKCLWVETLPRKGVYEENAGGFYSCRKDVDCTPCFGTGFCPGDRVCANLGQDDDTLADYRCIASCESDLDCAGTPSATCSAGVDGYGKEIMGCFDPADQNKNFCK